MTPRTLARTAGLLYLIVAVTGGFAELYVRSGALVPGDAAATAANIAESATLFRAGFATDLVNITCVLLVGLTMHALLKPAPATPALATPASTTPAHHAPDTSASEPARTDTATPDSVQVETATPDSGRTETATPDSGRTETAAVDR
ncbi:DUF4386 family protein [Phytohabitans sp. ZYX-F-186]|uniref:DUF4386 family protein n=1 Tax=Phytohabitans maris TaxID=3071409 RepID=A0ABU0ZAB1_9ACTN|nr:DUF4386 family protein [Phytohabitans sp. ZYX-F-186]MDQ7903970.1 DUF4386 family protein [Phytohabitans sp. ZYX-F-186]